MVSRNSIKLISLNIERDLHYGRVFPFLARENADVVCLQEVLDRDVPQFEETLDMSSRYAPIALADRGRRTDALARAGVLVGTALFSSLPVEDSGALYYFGTADKVSSMKDPIPAGRHENNNGIFVWASVNLSGTTFTIGTTHFSWTPDGRSSDGQRQDIANMLEKLRKFPDLAFCGDFNAPRGGEIWNMIASRYRDNIPVECKTSLDQKLHKVSGLMYVVDGLFTTPEYHCSDTRLQCGVSDHCAIVSVVEKVS